MDNQLKHRRMKEAVAATHSRLSRLALFRAYSIPAGIAFAFLILVVSGALNLFSAGAQALIVYGFLSLFFFTLVRGVLRYTKPTKDEVLETLDATDPHRPLSALQDHPARYGEGTQSFWEKHRTFLLERAQNLQAPNLSAEWRRKDPLYLRFLAPLLFLGFVLLNFDSVPKRLYQASSPDIGALFGADALEVSAWLTPPEHTGEAPVYLTSTTEDVKIPAGSMLTLRVHGGPAKLKRRATGDVKLQGKRTIQLKKYVDGAYQAKVQIFEAQEISLHYWGKRGSWELKTAPDGKPQIQYVNEPSLDEQDRLTFDWKAEDDYGVAKVFLKLTTLADTGVEVGQTDRIPLDLPRAFQTSAEDTARLNLIRHKWAGLNVGMTLEVEDTGGQTALSDQVTYKLPEKLLLEPLAKSSQEIRVTLMREGKAYNPIEEPAIKQGVFDGLGDRLGAAPDGVQRAALMIDAVTYKPQIFMRDYAIYLGLKRAQELIRGAVDLQELAPLDDLLWSITLRAEYGTLADAARRLEAARRALETALRNGAGEDEIRRLMNAFREAVEDYLAARMAEALLNNNGSEGQGGDNSQLGGQDLEDMLSALEDLTETGASDAARKLLNDVANLLNNLQFNAGGSGKNGMPGQQGDNKEEDDKRSEDEKTLQGALDKLSKLLEDQRRLNDDTLQERFDSQQQNEGSQGQQNGQNQPGGNQQNGQNQTGQIGEGGEENEKGDAKGSTGKEGELSERQAEILKDLQAFTEEMGKDTGSGTGKGADEFESARRSLERAMRALDRKDLEAAQWNQDRAIRELREGAGELAEQLDEKKAQRLKQSAKDTINDTDPLGRPVGGSDQSDSDKVTIPEKADRQRARDILETLRKRLDESKDEEEREYLKRLLDRFGS